MLRNVYAEIMVGLYERFKGDNILGQVNKFEASRLDLASFFQAFIYGLEKAFKLLLALCLNFRSFGL